MKVERVTRDTLTVVTEGEEETRELGARLGALLRPGDVVALHGNLGAGKTRLIQGIARGMGIERPVTSPTFILMNVYTGPDGRTLCHVDTYRLHDPVEEGYELGLNQWLGGEDVCVVEWAERIRPLLPKDHIWVEITILGENTRRFTFHGRGERARARVRALARALAPPEARADFSPVPRRI